jgi:quinol-cytochrome oxidoreductase complex cytochrome b subunit
MTGRSRRFGRLRQSQLWRSIFRSPIPATPRDRVAVILSSVFLHLHPVRMSAAAVRLRRTWCMGGLAFLAFLVLTLTGLLLMFHYHPTPERAYGDIEDLMYAIPYGRFMRNLHRWSGHAMILLVIAHMVRVFHAGAYRPPREFNWVVGVLLLVLTFFLSFTGYLLPWDQLAFWAVTVGANMAAATPVIGHLGPFAIVGEGADVRAFMLGERTVQGTALLRFYVLHCVFIPVAAAVLMSIHFYRVRRDGGVAAKY